MGQAAIPMIAMAAMTAASTGAQVYSANKQASSQAAALRQQEEDARKTAEAERQASKKAESNQADTNSILQAAQDSNMSGGSTLLTSAQGIDDESLRLGGGNKLGA